MLLTLQKYSLCVFQDIFGGDESKIMDMLDAIMDWADKNGFNTATV